MAKIDVVSLVKEALNKINSEQYEEALFVTQELISHFPEYSSVWCLNGFALIGLNKDESSLESFNRSLELSPDFTQAFFGRGIALAKMNNITECIKDFDKVIEVEPNADAYYNRALAKSNTDKIEEAINDYDKAIILNLNNPIAYNNRGLLKMKFKIWEECIDDFNCAINLDSKLALPYNNRGMCKMAIENWDDAINDFNQAIKLDPNLAIAYNNRGLLYDYKLDSRKAIKDFDSAIILNPQLNYIYYNRGNAKANLRLFDEAVVDCDKSIQMSPFDALPYNIRGKIKLDCNLLHEAIADFDKAIELDPKLAVGYLNRSLVKLRLKMYSQALQDCEMALELSSLPSMALLIKGSVKNEIHTDISINDFQKSEEAYYKNAHVEFTSFKFNNNLSTSILCNNLTIEPFIFYNKGLYYNDISDDEKAVEYFEKAIISLLKIKRNRIYSKGPYRLYKYKSLNEDLHSLSDDLINKDWTVRSLIDNTLWFSNLRNLNDSQEGIPLASQLRVSNILSVLNNIFASSFEYKNNKEGGVNNHMWQRYANKCTGICVVYKYTPANDCQYIVDYDKISYANKIDNFNFYDLNNLVDLGFYTKDTSWKIESELRIIYFDQNRQKDKTGISIPINKIGLRLEKIIFGPECKKENKELIKNIVKKYSLDISLAESHFLPRSFRLASVDI